MLGIDAPLGGRRRLQTLEEAHALLPDLLARQLCPHLHSNCQQLSSSLCLWASPCAFCAYGHHRVRRLKDFWRDYESRTCHIWRMPNGQVVLVTTEPLD